LETEEDKNMEILKMQKVCKTYQMGEEKHTALRDINLSINKGEFISVLGPSGSGKTTLMNIIGCLDTATKGKYFLSDTGVENMNETELARIRNKEIGFIFQQFQLLPRLSALQNVEIPLIYKGLKEKERKEKAKMMLDRVGLSDKLRNKPNQLSGGQQQRVAIARAMVTEPLLLLADEPTGALDQGTGQKIMKLFEDINSEGKTIIMITHDENIAKHAGRIVKLLDGKLSEVSNNVV
jgi:putative ABC transport system ATP-binding protein